MSLLISSDIKQFSEDAVSVYINEFKASFVDFVQNNSGDDNKAFLLAVRIMAALVCDKSNIKFEQLYFPEKFADDPGRSYDFVALERKILHFFVVDSKLFERDGETVSLPMMKDETKGMQSLFVHAEKAYPIMPRKFKDTHEFCIHILALMSKAIPTEDVDELQIHYLALNPVPSLAINSFIKEFGNFRVGVSQWSPILLKPTLDQLTVAVFKALIPGRELQLLKQFGTYDPCVAESVTVRDTEEDTQELEIDSDVSTLTQPTQSNQRMPHVPFINERLNSAQDHPFTKQYGKNQQFVGETAVDNEEDHQSLDLKKSEIDVPEELKSSKQSSLYEVMPTDLAVSRFYRPQNEENAEVEQVASAEEYRRQILQKAASKGSTAKGVFMLFAKTLTKAGFFEDIHLAHCQEKAVRAHTIALDGYAYDPQACIATLFILDWGDYVNYDCPESLSFSEFKCKISYLQSFYYFARNNELIDSYLSADTDAGQAAGDLFRWSILDDDNKIIQLRCVVLTLRPVDFENKQITEEFLFGPGGPSCVSSVYDYRQLYEMSHSAAEVVIDFEDPEAGFESVDMIEAINCKDGYRAYLGRMPATNLAQIYEQYGQRVLNGNVRAFLQSNNRVNKGMISTAKKDAASFFAYNNGICVVVREMTTVKQGTVERLARVRDFQIVNGGQTTATLHLLWNEYRRKSLTQPDVTNVLENVYVPMKLTVPAVTCSEEQREALIMNISKYANSQSAVSTADLGANTHFQIKFKSQSEHSDCAIRNSADNLGSATYWYYERSRGSYKVEVKRDKAVQGNLKKKGKTSFELRYPNKFTKIDLAKWIKSWDQVPHVVSLGGQKCYAKFENDVRKAEKNDPALSFVNSGFVKYCLGKGILFRHVDSVVANSSWYKTSRSYKANLVCYTVSYLSLTLQRLFGPNAELDFLRIWDQQSVPEQMFSIIDRIAQLARETFNCKERGVDDVGEWVKKEECWKKMQEYVMDFSDTDKKLLREWAVRKIQEYNLIDETTPDNVEI